MYAAFRLVRLQCWPRIMHFFSREIRHTFELVSVNAMKSQNDESAYSRFVGRKHVTKIASQSDKAYGEITENLRSREWCPCVKEILLRCSNGSAKCTPCQRQHEDRRFTRRWRNKSGEDFRIIRKQKNIQRATNKDATL